MVESLSVASLSVASKFTESFAPSIDEIQVRGGKLLLFSTSQLLLVLQTSNYIPV